MRSTRFTHPAAVDAWDQWFRWRDAGRLRDRTIDATWARVAAAVAHADAGHAPWSQRYMNAFRRWQVVPDERLLALAGTGVVLRALEAPVAMLNVAAFVAPNGAAAPRFQREGFLDACTLAVRLLDDALLQVRTRPSTGRRLRVGVLGLADAMALMDLPYRSDAALAFASGIGQLLDAGTLQGTLDLARERGGERATAARLRQLHARGSPPDLVAAIAEHGQRHAGLTAIDAHPRLAQLANAASHGIEPRTPIQPLEQADADGKACSAIREALARWVDAPARKDSG